MALQLCCRAKPRKLGPLAYAVVPLLLVLSSAASGQSIGGFLKDRAREAADHVKDEAKELARDALDEVEDLAREQVGALADAARAEAERLLSGVLSAAGLKSMRALVGDLIARELAKLSVPSLDGVLSTVDAQVRRMMDAEFRRVLGGVVPTRLAAPPTDRLYSAAEVPRRAKREAPAGKGVLFVEASAGAVRVELDGEDLGISPLQIADVDAGYHVIRFSTPEGESTEARCLIRPDEVSRVVPPAELGQAGASITVVADFVGASVFVGGALAGTSPMTLRGLGPGNHHVIVAGDGFFWSEVVHALSGPPRRITADFGLVQAPMLISEQPLAEPPPPPSPLGAMTWFLTTPAEIDRARAALRTSIGRRVMLTTGKGGRLWGRYDGMTDDEIRLEVDGRVRRHAISALVSVSLLD